MHPLRRTDDRIDGARIDTERAADAGDLGNPCDAQRSRFSARDIERHDGPARHCGELRDDSVCSRRATVDRSALGDRFGVGAASVVSAASALRLRQHGVDAVGQIGRCRCAHARHFTEPPNATHARRANGTNARRGADPRLRDHFARCSPRTR
jgi:hypothetical protein